MVSDLCIGKDLKGNSCFVRCYDGLCLEELRNVTETSDCPVGGLPFRLRTFRVGSTVLNSTATFGCFNLDPGNYKSVATWSRISLVARHFTVPALPNYTLKTSPPALCLDFMSGVTWCGALTTTVAITWLDGGGAVLVVMSNLVPRSSRIDSCAGSWAEASARAGLASEPDLGSMVRVVAVGRQAAFNCWHDRTSAGRVLYCWALFVPTTLVH